MNWSEFNKFSDAFDSYLPDVGEGDTLATQVATAVSKLVFRWFNDGDVYDNRYGMEGWCNDLSCYANWLYTYIPETDQILRRIFNCHTDEDYERILYDLCKVCADPQYLAALDHEDADGSVYNCEGPFEFSDSDEEDEDEWYEEDDEYDEYEDDEY